MALGKSIIQKEIKDIIVLTEINNLYLSDNQRLTKKLQKNLKKIIKKRTSYQKNVYLCIVLINNDCFTDLKKQRK